MLTLYFLLSVLAVLAAGSPDKAAFMADEAVLGILGQIQLKYTLPEYLDYMEGINTCLKKLRKLGEYVLVFRLFGWSVCPSVCLSVRRITEKVINGFA